MDQKVDWTVDLLTGVFLVFLAPNISAVMPTFLNSTVTYTSQLINLPPILTYDFYNPLFSVISGILFLTGLFLVLFTLIGVKTNFRLKITGLMITWVLLSILWLTLIFPVTIIVSLFFGFIKVLILPTLEISSAFPIMLLLVFLISILSSIFIFNWLIKSAYSKGRKNKKNP